MHSISKQKGITLSGTIIGCIVIGACALLVMKLWPVYNEKFKVDLAMEKLEGSPEAYRWGRVEIARSMQKQFDIDGIEPMHPTALPKALKIEKLKGSKSKFVTLIYEIRSPLSAELDVILNYNKTIEMASPTTD